MKVPRVRIIRVEEEEFAVKEGDLIKGGELISYLSDPCFKVKSQGELAGMAIYLSVGYSYKIVEDSEGTACLLVMKKGDEKDGQ